MKNLNRMLLAALLLLASCKPEPPGLPDPPTGAYTYGGELNDLASDLIQLPDGNFMLLGSSTTEVGNYDLYLLKVSAQGDLLNSRTWEDDAVTVGQRLMLASDGNVVLTAYTMAEQYDPYDIIVKKVDADLNTIWESSLAQEDVFYSYTRMNNLFESGSGYLISATVGSNPLLIHVGTEGEEKWRRYYPNEYTPASGEYTTGLPNGQTVMATLPTDYNSNSSRLNLTWLDSLGTTLKDTTYTNASLNYPPGAVIARPDNGFYVAASPAYDNYGVISYIDNSGALTYVTTFEEQNALAILQGYLDPDGRIVLGIGNLGSYYYEVYQGYSGQGKIVLDSTGSLISSELFTELQIQRAGGMCPTADGRTGILGNTVSFGAGSLDLIFSIQD